MDILQVILALAIFFPVLWVCYMLTEGGWNIPQWLQYKPWVCYKCLSFWSLTAAYTSVGLLCYAYITMCVGLVLTVLNTIALHIHQKNNTINLEEYETILGK